MRWVEPKSFNGTVPTSSIAAQLDRLANEVVREGWQAIPRYDGPHPLLRVFDPDVPHFGESISLVRQSASGMWWYRSSTGEDLAPYTRPGLAAAKITRILIPFVTAALAARTHQRSAIDATCPDIPGAPDPSQGATIAELQERFTGVVCWWGGSTKEWWALVPGGTRWKLVNAPDPDGLIQAVLNARPHR